MKKTLIYLLVAIIVGGALYGTAWWRGNKALEAQQVELQRQLDDTHDALRTARADLARAARRADLMRVEISLLEVAVNLEDQNFGTAKEQLALAIETLGAVGNPDNAHAAEIKALETELQTVTIDVSADVDLQRLTILDFAGRAKALGLGDAP